jgi:hypothetical protein
LSPFSLFALSFLFFLLIDCRDVITAEEGNAMAAIADKPVDVANFVKHCEQRRKYPVLLRVEFQVKHFLFLTNKHPSIDAPVMDIFKFFPCLNRRRAKWKVIRLDTDPSRKTDQRTKIRKSFPVSGPFCFCLVALHLSVTRR